jgi:3-carboxy-cis,cis-muconate cycloisomerase
MIPLDRDGDRLFSPASHVAYILRFEAALARACARAGVVSSEIAQSIEQICRVELFNLDDLQRDAMHAGTIAIPIVQQLISRAPQSARMYVHWGATSQDAIDTALVLQMRDGLDALIADVHDTADSAASFAEVHRRSVMAGRTLLQQAVPITFGLKAARWLGALARQTQALRAVRRDALVLQFGGAAGTLAALGDVGPEVARLLGEELDLAVPDLPWHAERDRPASVVGALGVTAGVLAKIATDIVLMAQTEVAEVAEGVVAGKGVSSAMPHKRNPVDAISAIAAARLAVGAVPVVLSAMSQEHERGAGGWQAEWTAIPDAFRHTLRAAAHVRSAVAGLDVKPDRMQENLERGSGTLMAESLATALTSHVGRPEAQRMVMEIVERAFRERISFGDALGRDGRIGALLGTDGIARALDPASYLGSTELLVDRALRSWRDQNQAHGR